MKKQKRSGKHMQQGQKNVTRVHDSDKLLKEFCAGTEEFLDTTVRSEMQQF